RVQGNAQWKDLQGSGVHSRNASDGERCPCLPRDPIASPPAALHRVALVRAWLDRVCLHPRRSAIVPERWRTACDRGLRHPSPPPAPWHDPFVSGRAGTANTWIATQCSYPTPDSAHRRELAPPATRTLPTTAHKPGPSENWARARLPAVAPASER